VEALLIELRHHSISGMDYDMSLLLKTGDYKTSAKNGDYIVV
jgi:hypothetical protein